jgi:hypothetical protein
MPPKVKPTQSAANRGVSAVRGGRGARGGRGGGRGGRPTTATASQMDQEEVSMPSAEVEAMKAELEMLRKTNNAQAKKAAEAKRKIGESFFQFCENINIICLPESRKRTADRLSQEMEEEEDHSTAKRTRTNSLLQDDHHLDEDEQALARNLPPVSTSRSRSNIILSDDDRQEGEGKSILLCC